MFNQIRYQPYRGSVFEDKELLRKVQARTRQALGEAISMVTARDARGFFEHCGYRLVRQLL